MLVILSHRGFRIVVGRYYVSLHHPGNLVTPTHSHRRLFFAKCYNQSAKLAHWLAPMDGFVTDILLPDHFKAQAELSRVQRQKNVADILSSTTKSHLNQ